MFHGVRYTHWYLNWFSGYYIPWANALKIKKTNKQKNPNRNKKPKQNNNDNNKKNPKQNKNNFKNPLTYSPYAHPK